MLYRLSVVDVETVWKAGMSIIHPDETGRDFHAAAGNQRKGVLLIHGLSGSPHEMLPIYETLCAAGYRTHRVTLPGHGDTPQKRFHETSTLEILDHCAAEYAQLADQTDEVYIVGHSLGGLCTLLTAAVRPPKLKGVVAFSTPYEHAFFCNYMQGFVRMPLPHLMKGLVLSPKDKVRFSRPDCPPWHAPRLLQQSRVIFKMMQEQVHQINVPVSLAHSIYDLTVPYLEMHKLAEKIGRRCPVKMTTLSRSSHRLFPASRDLAEAEHLVLDFLSHECAHMAQSGITGLQEALAD